MALSADSSVEQMEGGLQDAAADLENIAVANRKLVSAFTAYRWRGMDEIAAATTTIADIRDSLMQVAEKIGVGGRTVRDAHLNNDMIRDASKESLGHGS